MKPNGKKTAKSEEAKQVEAEAARAFYETFVAAVEEIMIDRKEGGHPVNAGYQMGYFILFANMFMEMGMYDIDLKKQMVKIYTNACVEVMDRITAVDILNHFEELYDTIIKDTIDNSETMDGQKKYILAVEMELQGPETSPDKIADCFMIAASHIAQTMEMFANL